MNPNLSPVFEIVKTEKFSTINIISAMLKGKRVRTTVDVNLVCSYTDSVVHRVLNRRPWIKFGPIESKSADGSRQLQLGDFENIDWVPVISGRHHASSYLVRKGLSRKAQLALQIRKYVSKQPKSILSVVVPHTIIVETWDAFDEMRLDFGGGVFANFNSSIVSGSLVSRLNFCLDHIRETFNEDVKKVRSLNTNKQGITNSHLIQQRAGCGY